MLNREAEFKTEALAANEPEVLHPLEFAADFSSQAKNAQDRVWAQAMIVETNHASSMMFHAINQAAQRGIDTKLFMDQFSVATADDRLSLIPKFGEAKAKQEYIQQADRAVFSELKDSGTDVKVTNPSKLANIFPFIGRNHMKIFIVDDTAWIGGVNIASDHFEKADFMVRVKDPDLVDALAIAFDQVNENKPEDDYKKEVNDRYTLLVDAGNRGKSIILDEANDLVASSTESVKFISQIIPSGEMLDSLVERSQAGVQVDIVTQSLDHIGQTRNPMGVLMKRRYDSFVRKTARNPNIRLHHFNDHHGKVHAKMVIVDGQKALFGSHNLDSSGVKAGTQEIALITSHSRLVQDLSRWFDSTSDGNYNLGYQEGLFNLRS